MVVGGGDARGVPVTFARGGKNVRGDFPDEDDENDVPTTVMPHGSQLAQSIRAAAEAARAREAQVEAAAAPAARASSAEPSGQQAMDLRSQGRFGTPEAGPAKQEEAGRSSGGLWMVLLIVLLVALAVLIATDVLPLRALLGS